jgi:branched-chain amino acid transport system permease protein
MNDRMLRFGVLGAMLIIALVLPQVIYPVLALDILLWGLFAVAVDLLLGYGGLLSFGHAAFWGSAAYAAGIVAKQWGLPFPLAALSGMLVAVLLALPIGYLSIRRTGIYFSMVTLAFAQMIFYVVNQWRDVTGGENGLQGIPRTLFGLNLSNPTTFYYSALPIVIAALWFAYRVVHSPFGHVVVAIRDNEARAKALGYPTNRYKLIMFLLSAGLAGLAGGLFSLGHGFAALEVVHWTTSGTVVMMTVLGGIGTLWGGLVGAALILWLRDWLATWTDAWGVITGAIFILIVLSFRRGLWGTVAQLLSTPRARRRPDPIGAPGAVQAQGGEEPEPLTDR